MKNRHACRSSINKLPKSDLDGDYTGYGYLICVRLPCQLKLFYWSNGNNPIPEHMKYNNQVFDELNIQYFMLKDSSEVNDREGSISLHVINKVSLNGGNIFVGND